ncbi:helix-turn-helix domain-containing protein [Clostridium fungisolvens]|uniref:HTH-type transcriptional activator RhaS n=1 Tax=Clostridium fungisolvens TaxID=1604897 RepID=A0A6V8SEQ0_9CLOT|nr:helix-turn-helix domain-containing protein [Clostridium fungisolvens]GFP75291.1 HTH-type transcriptional activator RhaS [Clostridium fungisolvens]
MRKEYIDFSTGIPVSVDFVTVEEYPLHWHNYIEILYVVKGSVFVNINAGTYELIENEIEIINVDEAHRIFSKDKDNKVLIFHIDPYFFEKYYNDIKNMFFYTNSSEEGAQENEDYDELRTFLSIVLCELVQRSDNYDEEIENTLVELLYHLINNFHYLMHEQEELRENDEQLDRYHRISKYIYNNYNNNITLQDIADKEFLSTHYLSHEIKYSTGYSFTELINLTRVEESVKLLLDTDKPISEISEEVGFSHTRYYNKNFKFYYKTTPLNYRKKYKVDEETLEKSKKIKYYDLKDAIDFVMYYLEDYDRFNFEDKINKINIDVSEEIGPFEKSFKDIINVGNAFELLLEDNKDILEEIQYEIGFEYARLLNVFSSDMGIFPKVKFYNWSRTETVLEYLDTIGIKPLIVLDDKDVTQEEFLDVLKSFFDFFSKLEGLNINDFVFQFTQNTLDDNIKEARVIIEEFELQIIEDKFNDELSVDPIYDTSYMLPFIIQNQLNKDSKQNALRAFDVLDNQPYLTNEVFFGYPGMVNDKGIRKASFYSYYLLNKLGDTIVAKDNGYIVTKKEGEYQILLYSYNEEIINLIQLKKYSKLRGLKNSTEKKFSLNIMKIPTSARVTSYLIDEEVGSSYNYWLDMGKPVRLNKEEKEILLKASFPKVEFKFAKKSAVLNLQAKLEGYGAVLIIIKEVQKHLK